MQRLLPVVVVAVLLNAGWARTAHATPIDVQFSGTYSYICGYPCPYVAPVQNGPGLIGQAGDRWNWFAASSAANQPLLDASGQTTSVTKIGRAHV